MGVKEDSRVGYAYPSTVVDFRVRRLHVNVLLNDGVLGEARTLYKSRSVVSSNDSSIGGYDGEFAQYC